MKKFYDFIWSLDKKSKIDLRKLSDDLELINVRFLLIYCAVFGLLDVLQWAIIYFVICDVLRIVVRMFVKEDRPYSSNGYSSKLSIHFNNKSVNAFLSGHANTTFVGAFFMFYISPLVGYIGICIATFVCFLRLIVKSHWISNIILMIVINFFIWVYIDFVYFQSIGINNLLLR